MDLHAFRECLNAMPRRMLKVIKTRNWKPYWGSYLLPAGAEVITLDKRPTVVLIRRADGKSTHGNAGEARSLPQRSLEKALAAAEAAETPARSQGKSKTLARRPKAVTAALCQRRLSKSPACIRRIFLLIIA